MDVSPLPAGTPPVPQLSGPPPVPHIVKRGRIALALLGAGWAFIFAVFVLLFTSGSGDKNDGTISLPFVGWKMDVVVIGGIFFFISALFGLSGVIIGVTTPKNRKHK